MGDPGIGGRSAPWSPARVRPSRFGTGSSWAAGLRSKGRPLHAPGLLCEGNTKERGKNTSSVLKEEANSSRTPRQARNSRSPAGLGK